MEDEPGDDESKGGRRDDPFDRLDADEYRDRSGDPFEDFEGERPDSEAGGPPGDAEHASGDQSGRSGGPDEDQRADPGAGDPFTYPSDHEDGPEREDQTNVADRTTGDLFDSDPGEDAAEWGDRDAEVDSTTPFDDVQGRGDPFESGSSAFERVSTDGVDPDEAWESLTDAEGGGSVVETDDETVEVSKHAFCEGCEHFSGPPDIHCTHKGTRILEFTDMEHVTVVNCPIVAERRELGQDAGPDENV